MERVLWMELYRVLEQVEGEVTRLHQHVEVAGHDRFTHLQDDIRHCVLLVQGLMKGTPGSAAYMRLVGLSGGD